MKRLLLICSMFYALHTLPAQSSASPAGNVHHLPIREYQLTIDEQMVNITGKAVQAITVNGTIPGPTLRFKEGEYAKIQVTNNMDVETSVHWHGLLLPNFFDGVPYLNTPPIRPGESFTYEFPIRQSGTYWYHSHTLLQEQQGVFGPLVIEPKEKTTAYDRDLILVLSDWTNDHPMNILRNLKRGNEWFGIKKGTATPLNRVIARGALGAQFKFWKQRMDGADIADVYYLAFLINGKTVVDYPDYKPGERIRLRVINAAASTNFWLTIGGATPTIVSADGMDVVPVEREKTFINIAETYDFLVTVPEAGKLELRATAQDGSGYTIARIGQGSIHSAPAIARPDKIGMMQAIAGMKMKMGTAAMKGHKREQEPSLITTTSAAPMGNMAMKGQDKETMAGMNGNAIQAMPAMGLYAGFNYDFLRSPRPTQYADSIPVRDIQLDLTGNMNRYVWSLNGLPLTEADKIKIRRGEVTRVTLNNRTMMHHPMHLHGHFFRVLNQHGAHSPLKHTVNVPPMQRVTIEFYGSDYGDWFFHCHILYHMMGGMARVMSYGTPRDERMEAYPQSVILRETNRYYSWGTLDVASHLTEIDLVSANIRNQFNLNAVYGYNNNLEAEFTYDRYLNDFVRLFGGINLENEIEDSFDDLRLSAIAGIKFFTPYMFDLDIRIDNRLRPEIGIGREVMIFPRLSISGDLEYRADFGMVNALETDRHYQGELVWRSGLEYMLSKNCSLQGSYDNRFGAGGGVSIRF